MRRRSPTPSKSGKHRERRSCKRGHKIGEPTQVGGGITRAYCLVCGWTEIDLTETAVPAKLASRKPLWH